MNFFSTIGMLMFIVGMFILNNSSDWNTTFGDMSSIDFRDSIVGFVVIIISLIPLFFGTKDYNRDHE